MVLAHSQKSNAYFIHVIKTVKRTRLFELLCIFAEVFFHPGCVVVQRACPFAFLLKQLAVCNDSLQTRCIVHELVQVILCKYNVKEQIRQKCDFNILQHLLVRKNELTHI